LQHLKNEESSSFSSPLRRFLISLGLQVLSFLRFVGELSFFSWKGFTQSFRRPFPFRETLAQCFVIGNKSLSIVSLIAIFTGMVIALQLAVGLGRFGLKMYIGQIVGLAIFRELSPVLTCLMLAARVGSGIAAELGSMVVTEQVLALEAMGASPVQKLVVPRVISCLVAAPFLTVISNLIGIFGAGLITCSEAGVTAHFFIDQIKHTVLLQDFFSGIFKALFFGYVIAITACYHGLKTQGGTEGVGLSTTKAVVHASIIIFISDFFLTKLFLFF